MSNTTLARAPTPTGYLEFQRRPEPALEWFEKHMVDALDCGASRA
jgi:hypothetical protein